MPMVMARSHETSGKRSPRTIVSWSCRVKHFGSEVGFDEYDLDSDGYISKEEFIKSTVVGTGSVQSDKFKSLDLDQDGKITREEWIAHFGSDVGFDEYDSDSDGYISRAEFINAH